LIRWELDPLPALICATMLAVLSSGRYFTVLPYHRAFQ